MSLTDMIIDRIRKEGVLSFHDYMDICLYEPGLGYYTSVREKIGASGDFFTSPHFSSLFGQMVARQMEEMWLLLDKKPFTIVEYGAGPGTLCRDILQALEKNEPLYRELRYCIIEKSAAMREKEREILPDKVSWFNRIGEIPDLEGCVLSNELIDNFPVHQVLMREQLMEIFVGYDQGFVEVLKPAGKELTEYFQKLGVTLSPGYRTEINLDALGWLGEVAAALKKGFVLTIDYGHPSSILYNEKRRKGNITCFHRHTMNEDPFLNIGEQDITSHINFSALAHWGEQFGLHCAGFTQQGHFLQALGFAAHLRKMEEEHPEAGFKEQENLLYTLLLDMGTKIKVLVQQKAIPRARLSGLQFAQPFV
jgi:SAM-dependent MidA family methyltransferase